MKICQIKKLLKNIYDVEKEVKLLSGLSLNEALVLCSVSEKQLESGNLAKELYISPSRISHILKNMEEKKYINRKHTKADRRKSIIVITSHGKEKLSLIKNTSLVSI